MWDLLDVQTIDERPESGGFAGVEFVVACTGDQITGLTTDTELANTFALQLSTWRSTVSEKALDATAHLNAQVA